MTPAEQPDWNDLRFFLAAAETGSLSAAARRLCVRHSTVKRRLDALEAALGVRLMRRLSDGVRLTDVGMAALPLARDAERAAMALAALARRERRRVRISVPTGVGALLAGKIAAFHLANQGVEIEVMSGSGRSDIGLGEADLAIRVGPHTDTTLPHRPIAHVGMSLYAGKQYLERRPAPVDPRALKEHDVIGFNGVLADGAAARWINAHGGGRAAIKLSSMSEALAATADGAGVALLPCILADPDPRIVRLTPEVLVSLPVALVYRDEVGRDPVVRTVSRFLTQALKAESNALSGTPRRGHQEG